MLVIGAACRIDEGSDIEDCSTFPVIWWLYLRDIEEIEGFPLPHILSESLTEDVKESQYLPTSAPLYHGRGIVDNDK